MFYTLKQSQKLDTKILQSQSNNNLLFKMLDSPKIPAANKLVESSGCYADRRQTKRFGGTLPNLLHFKMTFIAILIYDG